MTTPTAGPNDATLAAMFAIAAGATPCAATARAADAAPYIVRTSAGVRRSDNGHKAYGLTAVGRSVVESIANAITIHEMMARRATRKAA